MVISSFHPILDQIRIGSYTFSSWEVDRWVYLNRYYVSVWIDLVLCIGVLIPVVHISLIIWDPIRLFELLLNREIGLVVWRAHRKVLLNGTRYEWQFTRHQFRIAYMIVINLDVTLLIVSMVLNVDLSCYSYPMLFVSMVLKVDLSCYSYPITSCTRLLQEWKRSSQLSLSPNSSDECFHPILLEIICSSLVSRYCSIFRNVCMEGNKNLLLNYAHQFLVL